MKGNIIAGLDIGTTKVCCIIAEKRDDGLVIKGAGVVPSRGGMRNGLVANIKRISDSIKDAVGKASEEAGVKVKELNIGIAGEHIRSIHHRSQIPISGENGEVTEEDIQRLNDYVKKINSSSEMEILHILPEEFRVDGKIVYKPISIIGRKLESLHHVIMASSAAIANLERAVNLAGYSVRSKVLQQMASSVSVLDENEKDLGTILIDIGGGTTDIAVFSGKNLRYSGTVAVGGDGITKAIKDNYGIVQEEAERIKIELGYAHKDAIVENSSLLVKGVGANKDVRIQAEILTQFIEALMKELFTFIDGKLRNEKVKRKAKAGIVLTGGGAMLRGIDQLAAEVFGLPAKLGIPQNIKSEIELDILRPEYATALGLIKEIPGITSEQVGNSEKKKTKGSSFEKFIEKVKEIFKEL